MKFALLSTVINGAGGAAAAPAAASSTGAAAGGISGMGLMIFYLVIIFAAMYFLSIRPQKKRQARLDAVRNSVTVGDTVLLANGMFGKVADITAECFVIEFGTNKGVRIPVLKQEVFDKREPNLSNKVIEVPEPEKKSLFEKKEKKEEDKDVL